MTIYIVHDSLPTHLECRCRLGDCLEELLWLGYWDPLFLLKLYLKLERNFCWIDHRLPNCYLLGPKRKVIDEWNHPMIRWIDKVEWTSCSKPQNSDLSK
jgi:hypothetical protein